MKNLGSFVRRRVLDSEVLYFIEAKGGVVVVVVVVGGDGDPGIENSASLL